MNTVTVNGRIYHTEKPKMFVFKLSLARGATITWDIDGNCVIVEPTAKIDRPLHKLSSDVTTTIKG